MNIAVPKFHDEWSPDQLFRNLHGSSDDNFGTPLWTEGFLKSIPAGCSSADRTRVEPLTVQVIPEMTNGAVSETRRILNDAFADTRCRLE